MVQKKVQMEYLGAAALTTKTNYHKKLKEKLQFRFSAHKVIHRKYLIFHFIWFFFPFFPLICALPFRSVFFCVYFFRVNFDINTWHERKNSIICKWFAFNKAHHSKARRKSRFFLSLPFATHLCHLLCALVYSNFHLCRQSLSICSGRVYSLYMYNRMRNARWTKRGPKNQCKRRNRRWR